MDFNSQSEANRKIIIAINPTAQQLASIPSIDDDNVITDGIATGSLNLTKIIVKDDVKLGYISSSMFEVTLYTEEDIKGVEMVVWVELSTDTETISKLVFNGIVDTAQLDTNGYYRKIVAYDKLKRFNEVDVAEWYTTFWMNRETATLKTFRQSLIAELGLTEINIDLPNDDLIISNFISASSISAGTIYSAIGEIQGFIPYYTNKIEYFTFAEQDTVDISDEVRVKDTTFEDYDVQAITGVRIYQSSDTAISIAGTDENYYSINDNIIISSLTAEQMQSVVDNLYSVLDGFTYKPISAKMIYTDINLNLGDKISINDNTSYIFNMELSGSQFVIQQLEAKGSKTQAEKTGNTLEPVYVLLNNRLVKVEIDADKINFLISYNEQTSQFEITPEGASLITNNLDINAIVNFINDSGDTTKINGGKINTSDLVVTNGAIIGKFNIKDNMLIAQGSKEDDTQIAIEYTTFDIKPKKIITGIKPNGATTEVYVSQPSGIDEFVESTSYSDRKIIVRNGDDTFNIWLPYKQGTLALTSDLSYQKGNTVSIRGNYGGHLTGANKQIIFSINIPKTIDSGVTTATLKANVTVRCNGAYLLNNASVTLSATLDASARESGNIVFTYNSASALGGTNNSAVDIWVAGGGTITFS